jgi:murein L,D-transpeptidase YcbB/YkuD
MGFLRWCWDGSRYSPNVAPRSAALLVVWLLTGLICGCAHGRVIDMSTPDTPGAAVGARAASSALTANVEASLRAWFAMQLRAQVTHTQPLWRSGDDATNDAAAWMAAWYAPRAHLLFLKDAQWGALADAAVALLDDAPAHGLPSANTSLSLILAQRSHLSRPVDTLPSGLSEAQRRWVSARAHAALAAGQRPTTTSITAQLVGDAPLWSDWLTPITARKRRVAAAAEVEVQLATALAQYALDARFSARTNCMSLSPWHRLLPDRAASKVRLLAFMDSLAATTPDDPFAALQGMLWPPHPQYRLLLDARARYAAMLDAGGWETNLRPPPETLRKGRRADAVLSIKRRLIAERYLPADALNDVWDDALSKAVLSYQRAHQLKEDGLLSQALVQSLNVPAVEKLAAIDVTLAHYRERLVGAFPYFIFVNIPDFHVELWRGNVRERRHKIVVGNNGRMRRARGEKPDPDDTSDDKLYVYPNRTPTQLAWMRYVIYNPYWNVPLRIQRMEIEPKKAKNRAWFVHSGFEYITTSNGRRLLRQRPGPDNALGRVKLIFPNSHNTYLHDTNNTAYFKYPKRAYSHGCMRLQDPLLFAEHILRADDQYDPLKVRKLFEAEPLVQTTITLHQPIPVIVDYFITRVDDDGSVHFLTDVYHHEPLAIGARTQWLLSHRAVSSLVPSD